ncbi:MAG: Rrf2 family transcriptional regulator [Planctomycetes bacterium]|nr:Rrf2 family transcriptional regulator [Planctomycetota bacterium]
MSSVFRISEAASLALHSMVILAKNRNRLVTTGEIAKTLHASRAHLNKVFQWLSRTGLVKSTRGRQGGFELGKRPKDISLLNVYEAIEGKLVPTKCLLDKPICGGNCILGGMIERVNRDVRTHLAETRLSEFTEAPPTGKGAGV